MAVFLRSFIIVFFIGILFPVSFFPMGGKIKIVPMKTYSNTDIPDGEFLHYGFYINGEKTTDLYYLTKKLTNGSGSVFYRTYLDSVDFSGVTKIPEDYMKWPEFFVFDPKSGSVIESEGNLNITNMRRWSRVGLGKLIYWHYQLYRDKGYVEYRSKKVNGDVTNESKYIVKFNTDFPSVDIRGGVYLARFLDPRSEGIYYSINPDTLREPSPSIIRYASDEIINTKAGSFRVKKLIFVGADPFISKLMEPMLKKIAFWVEDSDRRIVIKISTFAGDEILEEISNVNMR